MSLEWQSPGSSENQLKLVGGDALIRLALAGDARATFPAGEGFGPCRK